MCIPQVTVCWIHPRRASLYLPSSPALCLVWTGSASKLLGTNIPTVPMPLRIRRVHSCGVERKERYSARPGMEAFPGPTVLHAGRTGDVVRLHACPLHWRRREKRRYAQEDVCMCDCASSGFITLLPVSTYASKTPMYIFTGATINKYLTLQVMSCVWPLVRHPTLPFKNCKHLHILSQWSLLSLSDYSKLLRISLPLTLKMTRTFYHVYMFQEV